MELVTIVEPSCPICGGEMTREAVTRDITYWYCKQNPNPRGPTRYLTPELKAQRIHHDMSCVMVPHTPHGDPPQSPHLPQDSLFAGVGPFTEETP